MVCMVLSKVRMVLFFWSLRMVLSFFAVLCCAVLCWILYIASMVNVVNSG